VRRGDDFASNTSSLTIAEMAAPRNAPTLRGAALLQSVPLMALVEVVRTITTSEQTQARLCVRGLAGKEPVGPRTTPLHRKSVLVPYLLDAIRAVERGVGACPNRQGDALAAATDGPLTLLDLVGIDTTHHIAEIMFKEYREARYAPRRCSSAWCSRDVREKIGQGFYDYSSNPPTVSTWGLMLGYDAARWHAFSTTFPALLFVAVLFDIAAAVTKRESSCGRASDALAA